MALCLRLCVSVDREKLCQQLLATRACKLYAPVHTVHLSTACAHRLLLPASAVGGSSGSEEESSGGEEGGLTKLERRRRERAAGDHPLQEAFREASARLLRKHRAAAGGEGHAISPCWRPCRPLLKLLCCLPPCCRGLHGRMPLCAWRLPACRLPHPLQITADTSATATLTHLPSPYAEEVSSEEEQDDDDDEEEEEEEGSEEEGAGGSGSEEEGLEVGSEDEEERDEEGSDEEDPAVAAAASSDEEACAAGQDFAGGTGSRSGSSSEEEEEEERGLAAAAAEQQKPPQAAAPAPAAGTAASALPPGVSADLPYTPPLPDSYEAFAKVGMVGPGAGAW